MSDSLGTLFGVATDSNIGKDLNWDAPSIPTLLTVELPYWLLVPDCTQIVICHDHKFEVRIKGGCYELFHNEFHESRATSMNICSNPQIMTPEERRLVRKMKLKLSRRKCKTVLQIPASCNEDVLLATTEEGRRSIEAIQYLQTFCGTYIEVVNTLVRSYRLSTYDYFPYEVSPWDVPHWYIKAVPFVITLLNYAMFDIKPPILKPGEPPEEYNLISPDGLRAGLGVLPSPGELDLLDAMNLIERGNYSDAVRRVTTAIETILESLLRQLIMREGNSADDAERRLRTSRNRFDKRLKLYEELAKRKLPEQLSRELKATRDLRNDIVHKAMRLQFNERGPAQRAIDTGRWIYNWLEDNPKRAHVRDDRIAFRSLGRHYELFVGEINSTGVIVHKPEAPSRSV